MDASSLYKILLIEDDPIDAKLLERNIARNSIGTFEVTHVTTYASGLEAIENGSFDIIIMDMNLPDRDTQDAPHFPINEMSEIPVIIVSSEASDELQLRAVREGAQDFISKDLIARGHNEVAQKVIHAIDRHKLLSELRKARDMAAEADRAKSDFLAMMSHEVRTPINGIMGLSHIVLEEALDEEVRSNVAAIKTSAENLLMIVNDILDFSKIEAGKLQIDLIPFNLDTLIKETIASHKIEAKKKKIQISIEKDFSHSRLLIGDPGRIRQIITNLLSNAIKFTDCGNIWFRIFAESYNNSHVTLRFEVEDEGIGIPEHAIERLFRAFSQVDISTTRRFGGTGLGLSICKRLVQIMGGEIGVRSEEGRGTLFWFRISLDLEQANLLRFSLKKHASNRF